MTEHGRSRRVNLKNALVQAVHYRAEGLQTHLLWRVRNHEWRTSRSGEPRFQAVLLRQTGLYRSGQKTFLATGGTAMVIRNQNSTKTRRMKEQRSCNNTEENGDHKRNLNMDHLILHLISESGKKMERNGINESVGAKRR